MSYQQQRVMLVWSSCQSQSSHDTPHPWPLAKQSTNCHPPSHLALGMDTNFMDPAFDMRLVFVSQLDGSFGWMDHIDVVLGLIWGLHNKKMACDQCYYQVRDTLQMVLTDVQRHWYHMMQKHGTSVTIWQSQGLDTRQLMVCWSSFVRSGIHSLDTQGSMAFSLMPLPKSFNWASWQEKWLYLIFLTWKNHKLGHWHGPTDEKRQRSLQRTMGIGAGVWCWKEWRW